VNREAEREMFEANPPQPGLDRFEREYHPNNMHAVTPHHRLLEQLTDRAKAIRAGDRVTADMLEAVGSWLTLYRSREARVWGELSDARQEIYRLRTKIAECCRTPAPETTPGAGDTLARGAL
jgi:hypothetical protein